MKTMSIDVNIGLFWNEVNDKNTIGSLERYIGLMINDEDINFVRRKTTKLLRDKIIATQDFKDETHEFVKFNVRDVRI